MSNIFLRSFLFFLAFVGYTMTFAQITASNPNPTVGSTVTYTYNTGAILMNPSWHLANNMGSLSSSQNGTAYIATIIWNSAGSETLALLDGQMPVAQLNITITAAAPAVPVATAATNMSSNSFSANWNAASGATSYQLDVSTVSNFSSFVTGYNNKSVTGTTHSVTGVSSNTTYYYRLRSYNGSTSGNSNTITVLTAPGAPTASAATNVAPTSFTANWGSVAGAASYRLDVSTSSSFSTFLSGYNNLTVASTSATVSGLTGNTIYYYRVRAVNSAGSVSVNSGTITTTTPQSPPVIGAATSITEVSFTANWGSVSGASHYLLDVSTSSSFSNFLPGYNALSIPSALSYNVTGLTGGGTYFYRVRAKNQEFWTTDFSGTATVVTVPVAPVATAATSITATSFTANWNLVSGTTGYQLDVSTSSSFSTFVSGYQNLSVAGTSASVTGLTGSTTYYYRVRAVNGSGSSSSSNTITAATLPAAPTANAGSAITATSFTASWSTVSGATSYRLDVSTSSSFSTFVSGYNNLTVSGTSTSVTGLAGNTTYYYRVRAVGSTGTSANSSTITVLTLPVAPTATAATSFTASSFTANWGAVSGITSYRLDVSTSSSFASFVTGYNNLTVSSTSSSVTGLTANTTYYYRVRAANGTGSSANSNTITAATLPATPTANAATAITTSSFTASWSSVSGATGYRLDVSTSSSFASFVTGYNNLTVTGTSTSVTGLNSNTTHYYRVRAVSGTGTSASSSTITLLTLPNPPTALPATAQTGSGFTANWSSVAGITNYRLDISTQSDFSTFVSGYNNLAVTGTSRVVTGLTELKTYYYRLRATNATGASINSNVIIGVSLAQNYIKTTIVTKRGLTTEALLNASVLGERQISYDYFDGLGRPSQKVLMQASPSQYDIVQPMRYDNYGREVYQFLPYVPSEGNGLFKVNPLGSTSYTGSPHNVFYTNGTSDKVIDDTKPFSKTIFEQSPLNRTLEQGSPGTTWQPDGFHTYASTDRTMKFAYEFNAASEVLKWTYIPYSVDAPLGLVSAGTAASPTYYLANQLTRTKSKDENYNEVIEYKDIEGRLILKKVKAPGGLWASTYYIYNDMGDLFCVLPPEAVAKLNTEYHQSGATDVTKNSFLNRWAFRYTYDGRHRMTQKQVPGADPIYMAYDKRDRLVLTQDGNQRAGSTKYWSFIKYDHLNRPVLTGILTSASGLGTMQSNIDDFYATMTSAKAWFETYIGNGTGNMHYYDNKSYPQETNANNYLTVTYYDNYSFRSLWTGTYTYVNDGLSQALNGVTYTQPASENNRIAGQVTGLKVKVLDGGVVGGTTYLKTITYYDDNLRIIQAQTDNLKGGKDILSSLPDFAGRVLKTKLTHNTTIPTSKTISRRFVYDHASRVTEVWHQVDALAEVRLDYNQYNALGQLVDKRLHSTNAGAADAKQSVDYRYNIRGWMTSINNAELNVNAANNDETGDYFGMNLAYHDDLGTGNSAQYNGNISAAKWSVSQGYGTIKAMAYNFGYDEMNRLTSAIHKQATTLGTWVTGQFDESGLTYDLNGNIKTLQRKGANGVLIDNLTYNYGALNTGSNKLLYVTDGVATAADKAKGFLDGNTSGNDFDYDKNGNMHMDLNKGIAANAITYNFLNLPELITRGGNTVRYIYDAGGRKLAQVTTFAGSSKRSDYISEFVYENDVMQFIVHEEGRIAVSGDKLLVKDGCENTGNKTAVSATLATYSANGENYIQVTASGTVVKTGVFPIGGTFTVAPGERYRIRAKGYRTGANAVYLMIKANTTELGFPGSALPSNAATEAWIEQIVTIPAGATSLQAGVTWNTVTAGQQFYLNEFEIEQLTSITPEYQYHLKDHLGNVRVTFTTKDETLNYTATFENNTQTTEQATFRNYTRVTNDLYDHTDVGTTYDKVQLLNGGNNSQVGITKSIAVMPGDVVSASVWAKYFGATGGSGNLTGFASALLSAFGLTAPAGGEAGTASAAIQSYGSFIAGGGNTGNSSWPKGWLNMLIFDKNYNLVDLAYQQLDAAYVQPVGNSTKMPMQQLSLSKTIKEPGYVYIYISNEGSVQQDIYFDDMNITHTKSKIIQADDYYPFGLTFNSYQRENSVINDFLYSGKEQQDELGLNWIDFGARMYMADIGRWGVVDPLAEKAMNWTPYRYAFNNPMLFIDPDGMFEYSNGYTTQDSRNETGSVSHSGAFNGNKSDLAAGSSAATTVIAHGENGNSVIVDNSVPALPEPEAGEDVDGPESYPIKLKDASLDQIMAAFRHAYELSKEPDDYIMSQVFDATGVDKEVSQHESRFVKNFNKEIQLVFILNTQEEGTAPGSDGRMIRTVMPFYPGAKMLREGVGKGWDVDETKISSSTNLGRFKVTQEYPYAIAIYGDYRNNNRMATLYFKELYAFQSFKAYVQGK